MISESVANYNRPYSLNHETCAELKKEIFLRFPDNPLLIRF